MFFIADIHCTHPQTLTDEVIRVTTARHYVLPGHGPSYSPHLKGVLNFEEQLFSKGATSGDATIGIGEVTLINIDGSFDAYRSYAFDGKEIAIYLLETEFDAPSDLNLFFRGTVYYAQFSLSELSLYVKNRLEIFSPLIQSSKFLGTNEGGPIGYEGDESDLKGKTKPMVWGVTLNVPMALVNRSMQMYACNYDINGNRIPVAAFMNVADKGGALLFAGDVADIAALHAVSVSSGFYKSCRAEGAIKIGRTAQGDITADVAEVLGEDASAPRTVRRILENCYGLVAGTDFDAGALEALHVLNKTACGYFVDEEVEGHEVITALLESIGGWIIPDRLGVFRTARFDLPTELDATVATYDDDLILKGTFNRIPTGDQGHGIPAKSYTLSHTKLWKTLAKTETLVSVPADLREYYAQEFRSAQAVDASVEALHPLAPDLSDESLMTVYPALKLPSFLEEDVNAPPSNWDYVSGDVQVATGNEAILAPAIGPGGNAVMINTLGVTGINHVLENQIEEVLDGKYLLRFVAKGDLAGSSVSVNEGDSLFTLGLAYLSPPEDGWNEVEFEFYNSSVPFGLDLVVEATADGSEAVFGQFEIRPRALGLTPEEEAARRLAIFSANLERYVFDVPIQDGLYTEIGSKILVKTKGRFGLTDGRKFIVVGKNIRADENRVAFDVIGADNA